jgi:hypothetical protein
MAHDRHERWGARKIKRWLEDLGHCMPAFSTVHNLMARHGLLPGVSPGIPAQGGSNMMQSPLADGFKGHFPFAVTLSSAHPAG